MEHTFNIGDSVTWNYEYGKASGKIIKIHTAKFNNKGNTHHASKEEPQYVIKSSTTGHFAIHKGTALNKDGTL